jgi:vacuolar protein sorting-associated protein 72
MADEEDEMKDGRSPESDDDSSSGSEDDSDTEPEVVPLVAGREKRATAGNRMNSLLAAAAEEEDDDDDDDDEVALLFAAEGEDEDVEFEGDDDEAGSDAELDSSSDDDDQGPNAPGDDDLDGERELQKQERAERAQKRKANDALTTTAGVRKKARFDPSISTKGTTAPTPKPSKRKEREPRSLRETEGPSRTSLRPQTVANTEVIRAKVKHDDEIHAKVVEKLKKKRLEREKDMPPEMTQADRLAEAEKVEKKNAKSLNRWEAMEKKRAEEQATKLAALHDRKLEGPVISWWSGVAKWLGPKLVMVGSKETNQEPVTEGKKRGRKPKSYYEALEAVKDAEAENSSIGTPRDQATTPAPSEAAINSGSTTETRTVPLEAPRPTPAQGPDSVLDGIHADTSLPLDDVDIKASLPQQPITKSSAAPDGPADETAASKIPQQPAAAPLASPRTNLGPASAPLPPPLPPPPPPPPIPETSSRNLVILTAFDSLAPNSKHANSYAFFSNSRKTPKPVKQAPELCAITSLPARYRDPSTGLGYANAYAYLKLQEMKQQKYVWSGMLGCYVGKSGVAARGVPDGFLGP